MVDNKLPYSVRQDTERTEEFKNPEPGIPEWMLDEVIEWMSEPIARAGNVERYVKRLKVDLRRDIMTKAYVAADGDKLLPWVKVDLEMRDLLDILDNLSRSCSPVEAWQLDELLKAGGTYGIAAATKDSKPEDRYLFDLVEPEMQRLIDDAKAPADRASDYLRVAHAAAYGQYRNATEAWDHSVKAIESVMRPVISPNDRSATLGKMLGQMKATRDKLGGVLGGGDDGIARVEAMVRLVWENHERHADFEKPLQPSDEQAQTAFIIAVTVVQLFRSRAIDRI